MHIVFGKGEKKDSFLALERAIRAKRRPVQLAPSIFELFATLGITIFMAPFVVVTFLVIPMMGQITVGFSVFVTLLYLFYRRSLLVCLAAFGGSVVFWSAIFLTIQTIKNQIGVPLFILTALGIPVCILYSMLIGARIWVIRGGATE
jgi:hypothetical protein